MIKLLGDSPAQVAMTGSQYTCLGGALCVLEVGLVRGVSHIDPWWDE